MTCKYEKIVIVGGGTAGWSAAAVLSRLNNTEIIVIEPKNNKAIGVGESTLPIFNKFQEATGLFENDRDWLEEVDGTMKFTIEFDKFKKDNIWTHPFFTDSNKESYLTNRINDIEDDFGTDIKDQYNFFAEHYPAQIKRVAKFHKNEERFNDPDIASMGYHIDSIKYGLILKERTLKERKNVKLINDVVEYISMNNGKITELELKSSNIIFGDLYIDCTGFSNILMKKTNSKWLNAEDRLYCNSSIVTKLPYIDKEKQQKNTTYCHALKYGWVWNVPLQDRIGTGYVYSDKYIDKIEAEKEFKDYLGSQYGYLKKDINTKHLPFRVGTWDKSWNNNIIAIGLSSFFVEPLESTGLALFQSQVTKLYDILRKNTIKYRESFNNHTLNMVQDTVEFIELHYSLSDRKDSKFWLDYNKHPLSDFQKELINSFIDPDKIFNESTIIKLIKRRSFFCEASYTALFLGYGLRPNSINKKF